VTPPTARNWLLRINHAGGPPGASTAVHSHPGAEAIYIIGGRTRQRTPHGIVEAGAGETLNAHEPGMVMQLASTGERDLEQLVMFVVDAERPFSPRARFED
jgi:quercetin dioxygenase-like cupin family protein